MGAAITLEHARGAVTSLQFDAGGPFPLQARQRRGELRGGEGGKQSR